MKTVEGKIEKSFFYIYLSSIYDIMIRLYDNKVVLFLLGNPVHISLCLQSCQRKKKNQVTEAASSCSARAKETLLSFQPIFHTWTDKGSGLAGDAKWECFA